MSSKCHNWENTIYFHTKNIPPLKTICRMDGKNNAVFYIAKRHELETWEKNVIIISSVVAFALLVLSSMLIFKKLKQKYELKYLNKMYEEHSIEASFPEISEDIDFY